MRKTHDHDVDTGGDYDTGYDASDVSVDVDVSFD